MPPATAAPAPPPTAAPAAPAPRPILCPACEYDRTGLTADDLCPECGAPPPPPATLPPEPRWLEQLKRALFRPMDLCKDLAPSRSDGVWTVLNGFTSAFLFAGSYMTYLGVAAFASVWRFQGPLEAAVSAFYGTIAVQIAAVLLSPVACPYIVGLFIFGHLLRAAMGLVVPVRAEGSVEAAVAAASFAPVGWAMLSWIILCASTVGTIVILIFSGPTSLEIPWLIVGGVLMAATAAGAALHALLLLVRGLFDPTCQ